ncbi:UNVERIFIED_CONTAM: hypothetical protein GTU68_031907, partial [Idotea baltica]|nr:hypothetical protein [Idotea baltica]
ICVDHSLSVDAYGRSDALKRNQDAELVRNGERYAFMKWASQSMDNLRVHPPGSGIMHTTNLEQLSTLLVVNDGLAHPDMLLGTDSHTPMVNGIGVLGWGVGGLEAESVMFGQAVSLAFPDVVGVELTGCLQPGVLATDLALEVTHVLRESNVTGSFVEFYGPGVSSLTADDRAVIANMAPEYGASTGYFPVDSNTLSYLERTARPASLIETIALSFRAQGLWFDQHATPVFNRTVTLNLDELIPLVAGPHRPQDRHPLPGARTAVELAIERNLNIPDEVGVPDGAVGIAAITSCTNTSSPRLLITAGLFARNANKLGLRPPDWVKTSHSPGSPSAIIYLTRAGLLDDLAAIGFDIVGFGCATCIGNSGPLPPTISAALDEGKAIVAVLSGNRNFPGRVHPKLDLGFLASPPLVVAYALKGDVLTDLHNDPLGFTPAGKPVFLRDLWPDANAIDEALELAYEKKDIPIAFDQAHKSEGWGSISAPTTACFPWRTDSRYLRSPKFVSKKERNRLGKYVASPLLVFGDDMTTDHISPAGAIDPNSEAGKWLIARGASSTDLNVYAAYRGNWEVMLRGMFTNQRARNYLA